MYPVAAPDPATLICFPLLTGLSLSDWSLGRAGELLFGHCGSRSGAKESRTHPESSAKTALRTRDGAESGHRPEQT